MLWVQASQRLLVLILKESSGVTQTQHTILQVLEKESTKLMTRQTI